MKTSSALCVILSILFPSLLRAADATADAKLELIAEGAMQKLGG